MLPPIVIIGCGSVGSNAAVSLARLGFKHFVLYDDDRVEAHNITSQAYSAEDIGAYKVDALRDILTAINEDTGIYPKRERVSASNRPDVGQGVVIVAVDTMAVRREIAPLLIGCSAIVDGRTGGGQVEVHTHKSIKEYTGSLPEKVSDDPCTARFTPYTAAIAGALITNQVKRLLRGESVYRDIVFHIDTLELLKN
jgi:hypothetical protein